MRQKYWKNSKQYIKWHFLNWVVCLRQLYSGFIGMITLGYIQPSVLKSMRRFLDYSDDIGFENAENNKGNKNV